MSRAEATGRVDVHLDDAASRRTLLDECRAGLTSNPKWLLPKWFYDARGSDLFEKITYLPEYYPARCEREILAAHASDIARAANNTTLIELGSGVSEKTRALLDAMKAEGLLTRYVPFDVCEPVVRDVARVLSGDYPGMKIHGVVGDFELHKKHLPRDGSRLISMLGGTIGNLGPDKRARFFSEVAGQMAPGDSFLLGTDLVKDIGRLEAAYNDAQGITGEFNRNVLLVLNRELNADFDADRFTHEAVYNTAEHRIEMLLVSDCDQTVHVRDLDLVLTFREGERMQTEISTKFTREMITRELGQVALSPEGWWTDARGDYALSLWRRS